jgi:hypothetical protein
MSMTRRKFLALGGSAALVSLDPGRRAHPTGPQSPPARDCVVLDLQKRCSLHESVQGYRECLADLGFRPVTVPLEPLPQRLVSSRQIIVPAAASVDEALASQLLRFLENGVSILFELGLAFVEPAISDTQCRLFRSQLGLSIQQPVALWPGTGARGCIPYVDYLWPFATKVRDFSRVVPLSARHSEVIAQVRGMTVGVKCKMGRGTLTVLGSPLGPVLRAGDLQAQSWLGAVLSAPVA